MWSSWTNNVNDLSSGTGRITTTMEQLQCELFIHFKVCYYNHLPMYRVNEWELKEYSVYTISHLRSKELNP